MIRFTFLSLRRVCPALRAFSFQLAFRAGGALHAVAFQLAVTAGVAVRAVVFQLAVGAGVALRTAAFLFSVRAAGALRAVAFQLAVGAGLALRAVAFQLAVRAGGTLHTTSLFLSMRASFPSHRVSCTTVSRRFHVRPRATIASSQLFITAASVASEASVGARHDSARARVWVSRDSAIPIDFIFLRTFRFNKTVGTSSATLAYASLACVGLALRWCSRRAPRSAPRATARR